jgi:hypothetical protein
MISKPRLRRAKQRPTYYKTECLDCELIISVKWERAYIGTMPTRSHSKLKKNICAFCGGTQIRSLKINEKEYIDINKQWDMVDYAEKGDDNLNNWSSWIQDDT